MTPQQLFDTAYMGLVAQGERAYDRNRGSCRYRTGTGLKCAIGMAIPDDQYLPAMDNGLLGFVEVLDVIGMDRDHQDLATFIQYAHDYSDSDDFIQTLRDNFYAVAMTEGLSTAVLL